MTGLINTADPFVILFYTLIAALIIFLGRKMELPLLPGISTGVSLILLIVHFVKLEGLSSVESAMISQTYTAIAFDFVLLLISFISYLWIDDVAAKKQNKKSYDDSLSWFWDKL